MTWERLRASLPKLAEKKETPVPVSKDAKQTPTTDAKRPRKQRSVAKITIASDVDDLDLLIKIDILYCKTDLTLPTIVKALYIEPERWQEFYKKWVQAFPDSNRDLDAHAPVREQIAERLHELKESASKH